jgi:hypothetical protein
MILHVIEGLGCAAVADIVLQWAARTLLGRRLFTFEAITFFLLFVLGAYWVYRQTSPHVPLDVLAGLGCLYYSGIVAYVQCKSVFSRGYSIRIMTDLRHGGGHSQVKQLQANYGGGMGMTGMLSKRLQSLADAGLLQYQGDQVGPLTFWGRILAQFTGGYRKLFCLEGVG